MSEGQMCALMHYVSLDWGCIMNDIDVLVRGGLEKSANFECL